MVAGTWQENATGFCFLMLTTAFPARFMRVAAINPCDCADGSVVIYKWRLLLAFTQTWDLPHGQVGD